MGKGKRGKRVRKRGGKAMRGERERRENRGRKREGEEEGENEPKFASKMFPKSQFHEWKLFLLFVIPF